MSRFKMINKLTLTVLCVLVCTCNAFAFELHGKVIRVADGDTVTLVDASNRQYKIRLADIDAPEKAQAFGHRSKQSLMELVFGKKISADCTTKDQYERSVCKLLFAGQDMNLEQVKRGLAWHYKYYAKDYPAGDQLAYAAAENTARSQRMGLWAQANPTSPRDFRVKKAEQPESSGPVVKMSRSSICHDSTSRWYSRTKHYTAYTTLQECLKAGGRLPKK